MNKLSLKYFKVNYQSVNYFIGIVLVLTLVFLVYKTRGIDQDEHNSLVSQIRDLKQIDADWNADVLKAKMGLSSNYDRVASPLPTIEKLQATIARHPGISSGEVRDAFDSYKKAMDKKITLIESFKSQNAIQRNSTHFLPTAIKDALTGSTGFSKNGNAVGQLLQDLYTEIMTFSVLPDDVTASNVKNLSSEIDAMTASWPSQAKDGVDVFTVHVKTVLRQQDIGVSLLDQINNIPTASNINEIYDNYTKAHDALVVSQQRYRTALIIYSAVLLILISVIGLRLIISFRKIGELNASALTKAKVELSEAQLQLVQSSKMSALGQMVAGIAHEINTPLAFVKGTMEVVHDQMTGIKEMTQRCERFLELLPDKAIDKKTLHEAYFELREQVNGMTKDLIPDEMSSLLHDGTRGIEQISEIVLNLKNFSRLDRAKVTEFDVREGLESTLMLARNVLKGKVEIEKNFEEVPKIQCSPSQINQVFLNIISNAAQAMNEKGVITLRTEKEGNDMVRIEIQDDGCGIPPDVLPKIFDPFFTTKEIGKGTGMGLSISYKIIEEHGGKMIVNSEVGIGTTFSILLPIAHEKVSAVIEEDDLVPA